MIKLFFVIATTLYILNIGNAQKIDYLDVRDSLYLVGCGKNSADDLDQSEKNLLQFDTTTVHKNLDLYYKDLGMCYYRYWSKTKDLKYADLSIKYHKKGIAKNPKFPSNYWQIAFINYFLGYCEIGDDYITQYKEVQEEKYWQVDQIRDLKTLCQDKK